MKIKFILTSALVAFLFISSCKKDVVTNTVIKQDTTTIIQHDTTIATVVYPVEGLWIGTYTVNNDPTAPGVYFQSLSIYPDGSILTKGLGADGNYYYASGSWTLSGSNVFSATIISINFPGPPVTQVITATFSDTGKMTGGVLVDTQNGTQTETFSTLLRTN